MKIKVGKWECDLVVLAVPRLVRGLIIGNDVLYSWKAELDFNRNEVRLRESDRVFRIKLLEEDIGEEINECGDIHEERFFVEDINFEVIEENYDDEGMELMEISDRDGYIVEYPIDMYFEINSVEIRNNEVVEGEETKEKLRLIDRKIKEAIGNGILSLVMRYS